MDNDNAVNSVITAIGLLERVRDFLTPKPPILLRGDISVVLGETWIHSGAGQCRLLSHPEGVWYAPDYVHHIRSRVCTRAEWATHFPGEAYPYAPLGWKARFNGHETVISRIKEGWQAVHIHPGGLRIIDPVLTSLHQVKGGIAAYMGVPDSEDLEWEIVE